MRRNIPAVTLSFLLSTLLLVSPTFAANESKSDDPIPQSILNEPTGEGSSRTDPGVDRDRIPPGDVAPTGMEKEYRNLDTNRDGVLDADEVEIGTEDEGRSKLGRETGPEAESREREKKFYDQNEDGQIDEDEFNRQWPPPDLEPDQKQNDRGN